MPLPFLLGVAVGAGAVVAYSKSDKLKKAVSCGINKTKESVEDFKEKVTTTKECIKTKKENCEEKNSKEETNE